MSLPNYPLCGRIDANENKVEFPDKLHDYDSACKFLSRVAGASSCIAMVVDGEVLWNFSDVKQTYTEFLNQHRIKKQVVDDPAMFLSAVIMRNIGKPPGVCSIYNGIYKYAVDITVHNDQLFEISYRHEDTPDVDEDYESNDNIPQFYTYINDDGLPITEIRYPTTDKPISNGDFTVNVPEKFTATFENGVNTHTEFKTALHDNA